MTADLYGLTTVTLDGRHELDPAMAVPMVVPVAECGDPLTGLFLTGERLTRLIRPVLRCAEQRFGVGIVVKQGVACAGDSHSSSGAGDS